MVNSLRRVKKSDCFDCELERDAGKVKDLRRKRQDGDRLADKNKRWQEAYRLSEKPIERVGIPINLEKFRLGKLCKRGHDWNQTGKSLQPQWKGGGRCESCRLAYEEEHKEHLTFLRKQWAEQHPERRVQQARESYERNKETVLERSHKRYQEHREEVIARTSAYHKRNPEWARAKTKRWAERNREKIKAYYEANKEGLLASGRAYYQLNKDKALAKKRRRRARKNDATTVAPTAKEIRLLFERCGHKCVYCDSDRELALEHFISLFAGGTDCIGNLVIACKVCNSSKGTKDPYQWFVTHRSFSLKRWKVILKLLGKTQENYAQIPLL